MRQGGSYKVDDKGKSKLVERTTHHPAGDRARDERGEALATRRPSPPAGAKASGQGPEPAPAKPAGKAARKDSAQ